MPGMELTPTPFDPTLDQLSNKIQEIRERKAHATGDTLDNAMDAAADAVGANLGRQEARVADTTMQGLSMEMVQQGAEAHSLDALTVASLIADPFED